MATTSSGVGCDTVHAQNHLPYTHAVPIAYIIMIAVYECGVDGKLKNRIMCVLQQGPYSIPYYVMRLQLSYVIIVPKTYPHNIIYDLTII